MIKSLNPHLFWTRHAWVEGRLQEGVVLNISKNGSWGKIEAGIHAPPEHATVLDGYVLPGMVNAHSHAFQRAFAGRAERRQAMTDQDSNEVTSGVDNFWSWRNQMYQVALSISPEALQAVATQLYLEMLQGGYTQVCEFHYLQHAPDGSPYPDALAMTWALVRAAKTAGIGLTMLPVLYERAGLTQTSLRPDQRRFRTTPESVWAIYEAITGAAHPLVNAGVAIHSVRAASLASIERLNARVGDHDIPIHIHISEQTSEVDDCLATHGKRPIDYLASHVQIDSRWQLVHATHAESFEIDTVAKSGAGLVMCPTTEANLGDGITHMPQWLAAGVPLSIGSDSHVSRDWREELRWLEYGQRLTLRARNVLATHAASTAARLFTSTIDGGGRAAGHIQWGLQQGARADCVVLDSSATGLLGVPTPYLLDAYVFACDRSAVSDVYVAGQCVLKNGQPRSS